MFCVKCGVAVQEDAAFCAKCGAAVVAVNSNQSAVSSSTVVESRAMKSCGDKAHMESHAMWRCAKCEEESPDTFYCCWSCGTGRDGSPPEPLPDQCIVASDPSPLRKEVLIRGKTSLVGVGVVIGIIVGYPLSYFFQPGALQAKLGLGGYIAHVGDVFGSEELGGTAVGVWIGSVIVFALLGLVLEHR